tara:strand:+ start:2469 stop:3185 length:717 start_codon:yes stop_codon:yes gene_type:complete
MNIIFPMLGIGGQEKIAGYPLSLYEIQKKSILERVIDNYKSLDAQLIFIIGDKEEKKYHLSSISNTLSKTNGNIITVQRPTSGALCTCLLAIDYLDDDEELLIANTDQLFSLPFGEILNKVSNNADSAVFSFDSVHPRWSYSFSEEGVVKSIREKDPYTRQALAGVTYFRKAKFFKEAAFSSLLKERSVDSIYYVAPSINELILKGHFVQNVKLDHNVFIPLYSSSLIIEFERTLLSK